MQLLKTEEDYNNFKLNCFNEKHKILIIPNKKSFVKTLLNFTDRKEYRYYYKSCFPPILYKELDRDAVDMVSDSINSYIITKGKCLFKVYLLTNKEYYNRVTILNNKLMLQELIK